MRNYGGGSSQKVYMPVYFKRPVVDPPPPDAELRVNPDRLVLNSETAQNALVTATVAPPLGSAPVSFVLSQNLALLPTFSAGWANNINTLTTANYNSGIHLTVQYQQPGPGEISPIDPIDGTITFSSNGYENVTLQITIWTLRRREDDDLGGGNNGGGEINENLNIQ